jgi:DNA invertase Pin-like site-specific DNA recombinase
MLNLMPLDSYIRVSKVNGRAGERFISPEEQRKLIREGARRVDVDLGMEIVEQDVSGAKAAAERGLETLLIRAEQGESSGIIVAWQDRLSRGSLLDQAQVWERLDRAGARFIAVGDGVDSASQGSEMLFAIKAAIAREQWKRYQANWYQAKSNAIERGVHIGAKPPLGYRRGEDGRLVIDEDAAAFVREIFAKRTEGLSWASLSRWTADQGRPVSEGGLTKMLKNPVYLGHVQHGDDFVNTEAHPPLLSRLEFDRAQQAVRVSTYRGRTGATSGKTLVHGLAVCGACGLKLQVRFNGKRRILSFQCKNALCPVANNITAGRLDEEVTGRLMAHLSRRGLAMHRKRGQRPKNKLAEAEAALESAEYDRDLFLGNTKALSLLGQAKWNETLETYGKAVDQARSHLIATQAETAAPDTAMPVTEAWETWTLEERRAFVFKRVRDLIVLPVYGVRGIPASDRVKLRLVGEEHERSWVLPDGTTEVITDDEYEHLSSRRAEAPWITHSFYFLRNTREASRAKKRHRTAA